MDLSNELIRGLQNSFKHPSTGFVFNSFKVMCGQRQWMNAKNKTSHKVFKQIYNGLSVRKVCLWLGLQMGNCNCQWVLVTRIVAEVRVWSILEDLRGALVSSMVLTTFNKAQYNTHLVLTVQLLIGNMSWEVSVKNSTESQPVIPAAAEVCDIDILRAEGNMHTCKRETCCEAYLFYYSVTFVEGEKR